MWVAGAAGHALGPTLRARANSLVIIVQGGGRGISWQQFTCAVQTSYRSIAVMATQRESPEYRAVRKHYRELTEAVTRGAVPDALFENEVITEDSLSECTLPAKIDREKGKVIMKDVLQAIRLDPEVMFQNFCDSLGEEGALQCVVKKVKG